MFHLHGLYAERVERVKVASGATYIAGTPQTAPSLASAAFLLFRRVIGRLSGERARGAFSRLSAQRRFDTICGD